MTAPGNSALLFTLLALFVACSAYAAGRLHQRYQMHRDREDAYRDGYDTATRSVFSMAARLIAPRRSAARGSARVKNSVDGATTTSLSDLVKGLSGMPAASPRGASPTSASGISVPSVSIPGLSVPSASVPGAAGLRIAAPRGSGSAGVGPALPPSSAGEPAAAPGLGALGFPVPPPPPSRIVVEPPAVGGVNFQRFPDPRLPGPSLGLPDDAPEPTYRPVRRSPGATPRPDEALPRALDPRPTAPPVPGPRIATGGRAVDESRPGDGPVGESLVGERLAGERRIVDRGGKETETADGRRGPVDRGAGHRATAADEPAAAPLTDDRAAEAEGGRHTVPDELIQAATYRLPPGRVFRAKVPDTTKPAGLPDDLTARASVPKPRQS
ncbi:hypothetical protein ACWKSP_12900 [Micromonosporaceae bacterium Da 78-11]